MVHSKKKGSFFNTVYAMFHCTVVHSPHFTALQFIITKSSPLQINFLRIIVVYIKIWENWMMIYAKLAEIA